MQRFGFREGWIKYARTKPNLRLLANGGMFWSAHIMRRRCERWQRRRQQGFSPAMVGRSWRISLCTMWSQIVVLFYYDIFALTCITWLALECPLVHQEILENAYRCLSVLIGVFSPFFKQVCCYAPLWRKQVPYDRLEFFLALQNCCNKPWKFI